MQRRGGRGRLSRYDCGRRRRLSGRGSRRCSLYGPEVEFRDRAGLKWIAVLPRASGQGDLRLCAVNVELNGSPFFDIPLDYQLRLGKSRPAVPSVRRYDDGITFDAHLNTDAPGLDLHAD